MRQVTGFSFALGEKPKSLIARRRAQKGVIRAE
jgi:hypothetical protein